MLAARNPRHHYSTSRTFRQYGIRNALHGPHIGSQADRRADQWSSQP